MNTGTSYHVFLTPEGDCQGLNVKQKTPNSFEVYEVGGGKSNVAFDYRIVALPNGHEAVRLADVTKQFSPSRALRAANPRQRITPPPVPPAPEIVRPVVSEPPPIVQPRLPNAASPGGKTAIQPANSAALQTVPAATTAIALSLRARSPRWPPCVGGSVAWQLSVTS